VTPPRQVDVDGSPIRYVGSVPMPSGEPAPVYTDTDPHVCNSYCRAGGHAELLYREDPGSLSRQTVQAIADRWLAGRPVLDLRPAPEAPLPAGYSAAWLVTYGPMPVADMEAER